MNLVDHSGRPIALASKSFREGGEGAVHELPGDPSNVAKLYKKPQDAERSEKLRLMASLAAPDLLKIAAWPTATLHDRPGGPVKGILMPRIVDHREIHNLYSPAQRKRDFPQADWRFLAHAAMNCAIAFEAIHAKSHVIGDVNQGNVLISDQAMVRLIDCDSFQVRSTNGRIFRCGVGVPEFTPPELQGKSFAQVDRTQQHDLFGLAVMVFHLLMMGRHPFSGRFSGKGDMPLETAIREGRFAYSRSATQRQMAPPPTATPMGALTHGLVNLFEKAFDPSSSTARPTATAWKEALADFGKQLVRCPKHASHYAPKGLAGCPWCALASSAGVQFFVAVVTSSGAEIRTFDLASLWAKIANLTPPNLSYHRPTLAVGNPIRPKPPNLPKPTAQPMRPKSPVPLPLIPAAHAPSPPPQPLPVPDPPRPTDPFLGRLAAIAALLCLLPSLFLSRLFFIGFFAFSGWYLVMRITLPGREQRALIRYQNERDFAEGSNRARRAEWKADDRRRLEEWETAKRTILGRWKSQHAGVLDRWTFECAMAVQNWEADVRAWSSELRLREDRYAFAEREVVMAEERWAASASEAQRLYQDRLVTAGMLKDDYAVLIENYNNQLKMLISRAEEVQRDPYLDAQLIENANISTIGWARKATLRSYGVESAFDVLNTDISNITGFGDALSNNLRFWAQSLKASFRFDAKQGVPRHVLQSIEAPFLAEKRNLESSLIRMSSVLAASAIEFERDRNRALDSISKLVAQLAQAEADVAIMA